MNELKLSPVRVGQQLPPLVGIGPLLTATDTCSWIRRRRNLVGWTYSFTPHHLMMGSFKKLIAGHGVPHVKVKFANNVHVKCYIASDEMVIGSFNLTSPTLEDLCVRVTDRELIRFMLKQFNRHWKAL